MAGDLVRKWAGQRAKEKVRDPRKSWPWLPKGAMKMQDFFQGTN